MEPFKLWLRARPKDIGAEAEYVFQAIAWAIISVYAHYSLNKESKEKFPLLLRMWWMLLLIVYVYFLFLNIHEMRDQNHITPSIVVEIVAFFLSAFLCYASLCGRTGKSSLTQSIEEPLLNDIPENSEKHKPKVTPYATASFISRMSFSWIKPLLDLGHKKPLDIDDVPQLVDVHKADHVYHKFRNQLDTECSGSSLAKMLFLIVMKDVLFTGLLMLINSSSSYVGPYFIDNFVQCLAKREQFASEGIILACVFLLAKLAESLSQYHFTFKTVHICIYIRAALTASLYKKGLMLSSLSRQKHTSGEIINYISVDAQRIEEFSWYIHDIWALPLKILMAMVILYQKLGLASLAGVTATVLIMMANYPLVQMQEKYNKKIMEEKDKRMKATSETLRNMRILKLQAWESRFLLKL